MKAVRLLSILVLGIFLSTTAHAKDLKIAYVELGNVFNNYQKTKDYDAALQKETGDAQKQIEDMIKKIRDAQGKLALLKEDEKQKVQADIDKQRIDLVTFQKQKQDEFKDKFENKRKEIVLEIEKVVKDIAQKDSYTFVLNDSALLFGDQELNVTPQVLKALNDAYSGKK